MLTMEQGTEAPAPPRRPWLVRLLLGLWWVVWSLIWAFLVVWAALALYYSNVPWPAARLALAAAFVAIGIWTLWIARRRWARWAFAVALVAVAAWFAGIPPSNDRPWRPEVAVLPRAIIDGDRVRLVGVRDFQYRTRDDFDIRYIEREVSIAHLQSLDLFISYWSIGPVAHTFVSFNFDNAPPVCISIETRPEVGEGFDPIASLFKQFELIYVVGEERDVVGVRAAHRDEAILLYRIQAPPELVRRLFREYLDRINELADHPEWYHLLKNSCTVNIVRYANAAGRAGRFHYSHLLNGLIDRYLYSSGVVAPGLPFDKLRRRSWIHETAAATEHDPDFSDRIRAGLPGIAAPEQSLQ
jgi:hypothetical protein